jgi:hypothetical protein
MFLISNFAGIFSNIAYNGYYNDPSNDSLLAIDSFCIVINNALANIAHWAFSFEYYNMVRIIPFALDDIHLP